MNRCIHLLLDFLKETGDHKMLLDLAIQLKYTPDLEKKYLRDNEREGISKEAFFLSVQILSRLKSEYAITNNRCENEHLLIQVYQYYKRVSRIACWQQKDNTLSKLLLNVYQNIVGTKEDVSIDIIIKYCQKLQTKEKKIEYKSNIANNENDLTSPIPNSKSTSTLNSSQALSTQMSLENQKRLYSPQVSHALPLNTQLSNQIMSRFAPYTQSPLMFPMTQETSYNYTLQQKLQATKQILKRNNSKPKAEKRSASSKTDKLDTNRLSSGKQKKNINLKINIDSKIIRNSKLSINKPTKRSKTNRLELSKPLNISHNTPNELKSSHNLDSISEINTPPNSMGQSQKQKPNISSSDILKNVKHPMISTLLAMDKSKPTLKTKTTSSRNPKSVYIDLDSATEQARLKSTIFQNKSPEVKKTAIVPLSPAMLLSSCPGLSITPVVNTNDNRKANETSLASCHVQNITKTTKNFNFEQLQHLSNSLTITKSEKNVNKKSKPELILID
uniref:Calcineurin-binding protein cabin-1 n=2 Tax=Melanaphis sacchari TaxID=742174 RepID=A0A2H8TCI2_9HEMI